MREEQDPVSLAVETAGGRSLLHSLLTTVCNGDLLALERLDRAVGSQGGPDPNTEQFCATVDHSCLVRDSQGKADPR